MFTSLWPLYTNSMHDDRYMHEARFCSSVAVPSSVRQCSDNVDNIGALILRLE